jgi:ribosomal protein L34E
VNAIFHVIQNILRRKEQQARCPHCGEPLPRRDAPHDMGNTGNTDDTDAQNSVAPRCPSCDRPLSGDDTP